jgi:hypothetical protein
MVEGVKQCRRRAIKRRNYHGDADVYIEPEPLEVFVWLCEKHEV